MIKATISSQYEFETEEDHHFIASQFFDAMMTIGTPNIYNLVWNSLTAMYSPDIEVHNFQDSTYSRVWNSSTGGNNSIGGNICKK